MGRLKDWTEAQGVPDDALVQTDSDQPILDLGYHEGEDEMATVDGYPAPGAAATGSPGSC
jgi:hypothetical protein